MDRERASPTAAEAADIAAIGAAGRADVGGVVDGLRRRRVELRLSQEEVEDRLGNARGVLTRWETKKVTPTVYSLLCWAMVLKMRWGLKEPGPEAGAPP